MADLHITFVQVLLMVFFGGPKSLCLHNLCNDWSGVMVRFIYFFNLFRCQLFLLYVIVKNYTSIIVTNIQTLTVKLSRVVALEKLLQKLCIANFLGVEFYLDRLGMTCGM